MVDGRQAFTDDQLIQQLKDVALTLGGVPVTIEVFNRCGRANAETIRRRFGSWWKALERAGLPISNLGKRYSEGDYFENLLNVWTHHGRQPSYGEMDRPPSRIPSGAYEACWGTWKKALRAFLSRVNADLQEGRVQPNAAPREEHAAHARTRTTLTPARADRRLSRPMEADRSRWAFATTFSGETASVARFVARVRLHDSVVSCTSTTWLLSRVEGRRLLPTSAPSALTATLGKGRAWSDGCDRTGRWRKRLAAR